MENRVTLLAAIVGAGPTVLIAYFLEFRYFSAMLAPKRLRLALIILVGYIGAAMNFFATIFAIVALAANRMNTWWDAASSLTFMVGLLALFAFSVTGSMLHPLLKEMRQDLNNFWPFWTAKKKVVASPPENTSSPEGK